MNTLDHHVKKWIKDHESHLDVELNYYSQEALSIQEAIKFAASGRGIGYVKLDHQRRLKLASLDEFARQLVEDYKKWPRFLNFSELFERVEKVVTTVRGVGDLAAYDAALRIGWRMGLKPDYVYLQAGARAGAKELQAKRYLSLPRGSRFLSHSSFPVELLVLLPYQIENFLCVFCDDFKKIPI